MVKQKESNVLPSIRQHRRQINEIFSTAMPIFLLVQLSYCSVVLLQPFQMKPFIQAY